jgi:hypothetical protein
VKHSLQLVAPNGKLRDKVAVVKLLRLFNLCDIGTKGGEVERAGTSSRGTELTANQHARMADLSLLLDMVLKTTNSNIQQDLIKYGVLSQLQPIILRTLAECFTVVMKKMMRVVDHLPLKSEDLLAVRSKHGCFVDVLKELLTHADLDVRDKAGAVFLKHKIPLPARREPPPPIIARRTPVPAPADRPGQGESPFSPGKSLAQNSLFSTAHILWQSRIWSSVTVGGTLSHQEWDNMLQRCTRGWSWPTVLLLSCCVGILLAACGALIVFGDTFWANPINLPVAQMRARLV